MKTRRILFVVLLFVGASLLSSAQNLSSPITTAVPFLTHSPDARSASLGFTGVATSPDAFSMYYNPAKYAFLENEQTIIASGFNTYSNIALNRIMLHGAFAHKFGNSAFAATMRYSFGNKVYVVTPASPEPFGFRPANLAFDVAYSHCFSECFSAGFAGRYIHSNAALLSGNDKKMSSIAGDVSVYYKRPLGNLVDLSLGAAVANIGTKMNYFSPRSEEAEFIPTSLRVGSGFKFKFHPKNTLSVNLEFSKLLVPTPPIRNANGSVLYGFDDNVSVFRGMLQSFYDATGYAYDSQTDSYKPVSSFYQELCEISTGIGLEYSLADKFFVRSGYYHGSNSESFVNCFTQGLGMHFGIFGMDLSYVLYFHGPTCSIYSATQGIFRWDMYFAF
ncbi:MAG: type IX secretion system outer membrane channel protein PorV [Bacteroidales bacterium]|nr:type IX secretion system outer membrane channel protein PorV [Bacteroidales bacterium]